MTTELLKGMSIDHVLDHLDGQLEVAREEQKETGQISAALRGEIQQTLTTLSKWQNIQLVDCPQHEADVAGTMAFARHEVDRRQNALRQLGIRTPAPRRD